MSEMEVETRAERCRRLYREMFSSPAVVIENVVTELETKLLPFSTGASDEQVGRFKERVCGSLRPLSRVQLCSDD